MEGKITTMCSVLTVFFAYYMITGQRLIALKIHAFWICFGILSWAYIQSSYVIFTSTDPYTLIRIATVNIVAIGLLGLPFLMWFFKKYLRTELEGK